MREALKNASLMLGELRTTTLAPRGYYELFIAASDELIHLRSFFGDKSRHGRTCMEPVSYTHLTLPTICSV